MTDLEREAAELTEINISHWQPYSEYKDSGVEWLGKSPVHWKQKRAKFIFRKMQRPVREEDDVVTCFRDGQVTLRSNRRTEGFTFSQKEIGYQGIRRGDLVIHAMDAFAGAVGVSESDGKSTPVYSVCVPITRTNVYYYAYLVRHMAMSDFILSLAKGIRERSTEFRWNEFSEVILPVPPYEEQLIIAAFLDRKTAEINKLIAKKRELIALLQEQRSALISHAVTKGLNSDAPMKDSGIEWIGEIPAHWKQTRIKYISSLKGRLGWQNLRADEYTDEGPYVVSSEQFSNHQIVWAKCPHVTFERYLLDTNIQLANHDVLLMKDGAAMGKLAYVGDLPDLACLNSHLLLFRPKYQRYVSRFMFFLLAAKSFQHYIKIYGTGSTFLGISQRNIGDFELFLPSLDEQKAIVKYIEREIAKLDSLVIKTEDTLSRLWEYRTALISAAVTGKIDVQGEEDL